MPVLTGAFCFGIRDSFVLGYFGLRQCHCLVCLRSPLSFSFRQRTIGELGTPYGYYGYS